MGWLQDVSMGVMELLESMILGVWLLLTIRLGDIQVRLFPMAILRLTGFIHEKNVGGRATSLRSSR